MDILKRDYIISFAKFSDVGERKVNEDSVGDAQIGNLRKLFILADGLGGHGRGEEASALITEVSSDVFCNHYLEESCLSFCFEQSQKALMDKQIEENAQRELKSTLVLLGFFQNELQWGHVGDSRLYHFEKGKIVERTIDHSVPQMLVASGEIEEKDIRHHPDRNRLLRVMGMEWDSPKYQLSNRIPLQHRQAFLMCSDGFWENIEERQMEHCLSKAEDVNDWLGRMQKIALENGKGTSMDNYSALAVFVE